MCVAQPHIEYILNCKSHITDSIVLIYFTDMVVILPCTYAESAVRGLVILDQCAALVEKDFLKIIWMCTEELENEIKLFSIGDADITEYTLGYIFGDWASSF